MNEQEEKLITEKWEAYCNEINAYHREDGTWGSKENAKTYSLTKRAKKHLAKDSEVEIGRGRVTKNGKVAAKFGMNTGSPDKQCGRLNFSGDKKKKTRSCKDYPENYKESLLTEPEIAEDGSENQYPTNHSSIKSKPTRRVIKVKIRKKTTELEEEQADRDRPVSKMRKLDKTLPGYADLKRLGRGIYENKDIVLTSTELIQALENFLREHPDQVEVAARQLNKVGLFSRVQIADKCRSMGRYSLADWLEIQNRQSLAQKGELNKPPKTK